MDRNLIIRTISGAFLVVFIFGSIIAGPIYFHILMLAVIFFGVQEYLKITKVNLQKHFLILFGIQSVLIWILPLLFQFGFFQERILLLIIPILFLSFIGVLLNPMSFSLLKDYVFPLVYVVIPLSLLVLFYNPSFSYIPDNYSDLHFDSNKQYLLLFFLLIWAYDTFAYLVGRLIGKRQLAPVLSPKKTWEGSIGGGLVALITAIIIQSYFDIFSTTIEVIIFVIITSVFGTFGDLFESAIKRSTGVKDSGTIIPGHGGVLDRFDSVFFAAPFVFAYLLLLNL